MNYHLLFPDGEWTSYLLLGRKRLELWGGVECSVNRVGSRYSDQLRRSGHWERLDDLDRIAELGIRKLRYPILWEHHPRAEAADWSWADARMARLQALDVCPIVGLVHHGSGPAHTSLLDPAFARGLAIHAGQVARRYPGVKWFTPVNEPLTTVRFSGLYGHWYPHARDDRSFLRALLTQCEAVRQSMRAIRRVTPDAKLVQTEDMGRTYSTPELAHQAAFDNERRWLSLDLLGGLVDQEHPLWTYLRDNGVSERELDSWVNEPCPPDIVGINYYVTSERFLDHRIERYPDLEPGGNGRDMYIDLAAVRVIQPGITGVYGILKEVWERYELPVAVTETHLGCTREEQVRWLVETWRSAQCLLAEGMEVRAVTAWSLLGAFDWDNLLTDSNGCYEPGAFDVRGSSPRSTAIARCLRQLARQRDYQHPLLGSPGWWRREDRLLYAGCAARQKQPQPGAHSGFRRSLRRKLLITGATGTLGRAFQRLAGIRGLEARLSNRQELDIADPARVQTALAQWKPWAVINTAGFVRVDDAEAEEERCWRENVTGPVCLAQVCAALDIPFMTFSSDLVFDGAKESPYLESDAPNPLNVYGQTKAEAEKQVLQLLPAALVIRTSAFFGPWDDHNFVTQTLRRVAAGERVRAAVDSVVSPTYVPDLVNACLDLLLDEEKGIWHIANSGAVSLFQLARAAARWAGLRDELVEEVPASSMAWRAPRPAYSVLGSERGQLLSSWEDALRRCLSEHSRPGKNGAERTGTPRNPLPNPAPETHSP